MGNPVLLYDGLCGFCDRTVQFILARDPAGTMRFAPLQGDFAREVLARHQQLQGVDSLVLVNSGPAGAPPLVRSDAILGITDYLGWPWRAFAVLRLVPRALRDWGYDLFARHRYHIFGRFDSCPLPDAAVRARFID